jgi:hypothetical protein
MTILRPPSRRRIAILPPSRAGSRCNRNPNRQSICNTNVSRSVAVRTAASIVASALALRLERFRMYAY